MTRYDTRICTVCGQEIEPGDVAVQPNGMPRHWECSEQAA